MPTVRRLFRVLSPPDAVTGDPLPIEAYLDADALVVLGDPGSGKTTCFEKAATIEDSAEYVSVRDFLTLATERWAGNFEGVMRYNSDDKTIEYNTGTGWVPLATA